jgi:hypothetical protein
LRNHMGEEFLSNSLICYVEKKKWWKLQMKLLLIDLGKWEIENIKR